MKYHLYIYSITTDGDGDAEIEESSGSDGKGEWSEMVGACVEEGWWACFEKSIWVWSEGQEEVRMTKDMEDTSGEWEQECWFGEGGYLESSKMESRSWSDCCYSRVNPATPVLDLLLHKTIIVLN